MSDTYNPLEKEYEQTRGALKLISKYGFGVRNVVRSGMEWEGWGQEVLVEKGE